MESQREGQVGRGSVRERVSSGVGVRQSLRQEH